MKTLKKIQLHDARVLTNPEMKHVTGGFSTTSGATNGCDPNAKPCGGDCSVDGKGGKCGPYEIAGKTLCACIVG